MNRTSIEWVRNLDGSRGFTWNPSTGCLGPNGKPCDYCYARRIARRFGKTKAERAFRPQFHPDRLGEPARRKKPSTIFVGSMTDLFGEWVPRKQILEVLLVAHENPQHRFLFLTKNPARYREFEFLQNSWLGFTAVDQDAYDAGSIHMARKLNTTFCSVEPMLCPVRLTGFAPDWVIVGAQTGPGARQPHWMWVTDLISDASLVGAPVFVKDNVEMDGRKPQEFLKERSIV